MPYDRGHAYAIFIGERMPTTKTPSITPKFLRLSNAPIIRFTLDAECPVDEYLDDGLCDEYFPLDDQTYQIILKDVDETLLESMNPDDLAEFFGIESEFVIAMEVI
jgi:hypothetical protein